MSHHCLSDGDQIRKRLKFCVLHVKRYRYAPVYATANACKPQMPAGALTGKVLNVGHARVAV